METNDVFVYPTSHSSGLRIRDLFALKAMELLFNTGGKTGEAAREDNEKLARWAYEMAEVMMKEREALDGK